MHSMTLGNGYEKRFTKSQNSHYSYEIELFFIRQVYVFNRMVILQYIPKIY